MSIPTAKIHNLSSHEERARFYAMIRTLFAWCAIAVLAIMLAITRVDLVSHKRAIQALQQERTPAPIYVDENGLQFVDRQSWLMHRDGHVTSGRDYDAEAPGIEHELQLQHEAIRQLAIATHILGAECNPRRKFAPLHMPPGFDVGEIEIGGEERPKGFKVGERRGTVAP